MDYTRFLDYIKTEECIKFYDYLYFPKDNELWYKGNVYLVEFTDDGFYIVGNNRPAKNLIDFEDTVNLLSEFTGTQSKVSSNIDASTILSVYGNIDVLDTQNILISMNKYLSKESKPRAKIIEIIDRNFAISCFDTFGLLNLYSLIILEDDTRIEVLVQRDEEGYYYKLKVADFYVMNILFDKLIKEGFYVKSIKDDYFSLEIRNNTEENANG